MSDRDVTEIKLALSDPTRVLEMLGMMGQGKARARQAGGWMIRCPAHEDGSPSCSVQQRDGVILWKCWGCGATGDVLHLVAFARGLKLETDFKATLLEAARLAGMWGTVDRLEGRVSAEPRQDPPTPPRRAPEPPPEWPPQAEVDALWSSCTRTTENEHVAEYLRGRALSPETIDELDIARALPPRGTLPSWAFCRHGNWREAGYRLIVPMYDATGAMRSVRCWRVVDGDAPKRLPPSGHKASELVMVDAAGQAMLRSEDRPYRITIVEGEPDFLTRASVTTDAKAATVGIVNGSWTPAFAERVPLGCRVAIRTDVDEAGDRYALEIEATLRRRAFIWRLQP